VCWDCFYYNGGNNGNLAWSGGNAQEYNGTAWSNTANSNALFFILNYQYGITTNGPGILVTPTGQVGIGTGTLTNMGAKLLLGANAGNQLSAPLKFLLTGAGTMTTPEPGALETDGSHLYWTDSGGTRHTITFSN
jgi:hypothetical protein